MSELDEVVGQVVPLVGAAVRAYGVGVFSQAQHAAEDATVGLGRRLVQRIRGGAVRPAVVDSAVEELAEAPGDEDALEVLRLQVRRVLAQDPGLLGEVAGMLGGARTVNVSGSGAVGAGGDVNVSAVGGVAGASIQGPVVVLNPRVPDPGVS